MSAPKKKQEPMTLAAAESKQPVAVGDVVLYALRTRSGSTLIPMMVTRLADGTEIVDGVLMSADINHFANGTGTKRIEAVKRGEGEGQWRPRQ